MKHASENPFDSIESAHNFVRLLSEAVADGRRDLEADVERELKLNGQSDSPRRLKALRVAAYNLEKLEVQLNRSRRILNDLRSLRRLLFEERATSRPVAAKPVQKAETESKASEPKRPLNGKAAITKPAPSPRPAAMAN